MTIPAEDRQAATGLDKLFQAAAERLRDNPFSGPPGRIAGTRELFPYENYRLVYDVRETKVAILSLVHAARLWPPPQETQ